MVGDYTSGSWLATGKQKRKYVASSELRKFNQKERLQMAKC